MSTSSQQRSFRLTKSSNRPLVPDDRAQSRPSDSNASRASSVNGRRGGVRGTRAASGPPALGEEADGSSQNTPRHRASDFEPILLDATELARYLGIGRTKAYALIARREVPVIRIGRCVRVPRPQLADWVSANTSLPRLR